MRLDDLTDPRALAGVLLVISTFVLAVQLLNPPELVVTGSGDDPSVEAVGYYFAYRDTAVVAIFAAIFGASASYLLLDAQSSVDETQEASNAEIGQDSEAQSNSDDEKSNREQWEETAARLSDTDRVVFEAAMETGGEIRQRDIVNETDLSKATVSRTLSNLESRGLLERERRGMGNVVVLQ